MSEVVGEAVIRVRTDESGVDTVGAGRAAGQGYTRGFVGSLGRIAVAIGGVLAARKVIDFTKQSIGEAREAQKVGAATEQIIKTTGGAANVTAKQVGDLTTALSLKSGMDDELIQSGSNLILTFKNVKNEGTGLDAIFNRANAAAVDLSAAGFGSVSSASLQLGKALNDPVKGIAALSRAGVTFTQTQKDQISALVEQGDLLGAQKIILKEVEGQVGGVAAKTATAGEKSATAWANVKEAVGGKLLPVLDRLERFFVARIVPAIFSTLDATGKIGPAFSRVRGFIEKAFTAATGKTIGQVADTIRDLAHKALPALSDGFKAVRPFLLQLVGLALVRFHQIVEFVRTGLIPAFKNLIPVVLPLFQQLADLLVNHVLPVVNTLTGVLLDKLGPALVAITGFLASNATTVQAVLVVLGTALALWKAYNIVMGIVGAATKVFAAIQTALNIVLAANPIVLVVIALAALAAGLIYAYTHSEKFRAIVDKTFKAIKAVVVGSIDFVVSFVRDHWKLLLGIITGPLGLLVVAVVTHLDQIKAAFHKVVGAVKDAAGDFIDAVLFIPKKILQLDAKFLHAGVILIRAFLKGLGNAGGFVTGFADKIWEALKGVINDGIDRLNDLLDFTISVPGPDIHVSAPNIGHLASGTTSWGGGWSWVGEKGPELMRLPRGSQVLPAPQSAALTGGTGGVQFTGPIHVEAHDYQDFTRQMENRGRLAAVGGRRLVSA